MLCRAGKGVDISKKLVATLISNLQILDTNRVDGVGALNSAMPGYEDALLACCAKRHGVKVIITRNGKDFMQSPVEALSPQGFLDSIWG